MRDRLTAIDLSWISGELPHTHWVYTAKTRYRQADAACVIESLEAGRCRIRFTEPQWAVTPGQSVVIYDQHVCLGGGVIRGATQNGMSPSMSSKPLDGRDGAGAGGRGAAAGA